MEEFKKEKIFKCTSCGTEINVKGNAVCRLKCPVCNEGGFEEKEREALPEEYMTGIKEIIKERKNFLREPSLAEELNGARTELIRVSFKWHGASGGVTVEEAIRKALARSGALLAGEIDRAGKGRG